MLTITVQVNAPLGQVGGIKEAIVMDLERYGDVRVVSVVESKPEQMTLFFRAALGQTSLFWTDFFFALGF